MPTRSALHDDDYGRVNPFNPCLPYQLVAHLPERHPRSATGPAPFDDSTDWFSLQLAQAHGRNVPGEARHGGPHRVNGSSASASKSPGAAAMHQSGSVGVRSARPPASVTSRAPGTQSQR